MEIQKARPAWRKTNREVIPQRHATPVWQPGQSGAFIGTAASVASVLDELAERPRALILDFSQVPLLDSTAAATMDGFGRKAARAGAMVHATGVTKPVRRRALRTKWNPPAPRPRF